MNRPFKSSSVEELERLVDIGVDDETRRGLRDELAQRSSRRAHALLARLNNGGQEAGEHLTPEALPPAEWARDQLFSLRLDRPLSTNRTVGLLGELSAEQAVSEPERMQLAGYLDRIRERAGLFTFQVPAGEKLPRDVIGWLVGSEGNAPDVARRLMNDRFSSKAARQASSRPLASRPRGFARSRPEEEGLLYMSLERIEAPKKTWFVQFEAGFRKVCAALDKNMRARLYDAIAEISESPMVPRGDTVKPLSSGLKGAWRYRIGDYRLIYVPEDPPGVVHLVSFGARGGAYD